MATNKTELNSKVLIVIIVALCLSLIGNGLLLWSKFSKPPISIQEQKNLNTIDSLENVITNLPKDSIRIDTIKVPKLKLIYDEIEKKYPEPTLIEPDSLVKLWSKLSRQR